MQYDTGTFTHMRFNDYLPLLNKFLSPLRDTNCYNIDMQSEFFTVWMCHCNWGFNYFRSLTKYRCTAWIWFMFVPTVTTLTCNQKSSPFPSANIRCSNFSEHGFYIKSVKTENSEITMVLIIALGIFIYLPHYWNNFFMTVMA